MTIGFVVRAVSRAVIVEMTRWEAQGRWGGRVRILCRKADPRARWAGVGATSCGQALMHCNTSVRNGSWLCENADVLRRRRIAFSSARCFFLLARGSPLGTHRCGRGNLENSAVPTLLARGSRLGFSATMCRAKGDLQACWNRILRIFDLYTFSQPGRDRGTARATLGKGLAVSAFPLYVPV
jgi:hypothetical protein